MGCGLAYRSLRPSPEELADLYRDADDTVYETELQNRFHTAKRHRRIVQRFHRAPGSMIDIGSASGAFLSVMSDAGWKAIGVEPSASQCRRALALLHGRAEVREAVLENAELPSNVDLVTLWDVLEHVPDPNSFLSRCAKLVGAKGVLALNVPNIDSRIARLLGRKWPLLLAEHLNYFTPRSLRLCAQNARLEVIALGVRPVSFSFHYILYRLSQHNIVGTKSLDMLAQALRIGSITFPVWLGELYAICRRKD